MGTVGDKERHLQTVGDGSKCLFPCSSLCL